jgi:signal peptide peptidase SppA
MNLLSLLGGQMLWVGGADSFAQLVMTLVSDDYSRLMVEAERDRAEFFKGRDFARTQQAAMTSKLSAAMTSAGIMMQVNSGADDSEAEAERKAFSSAPLQVLDNGVGVISINGGLVNSDKWYLKYLGMVGYPHIQDSIVEAYSNPDVKSVVLSIKSPGGAVSGIAETAAAVRALGTIKPVSTHAEGIMASGGYWLGSQTGDVMAASMTQIGSIGVVMTHIEYSKMMENAGITATVLRKGEYKMLMTPHEPLSDKAKAQAHSDMNVIYDAFTQDVANGMGVSQDTVKNSWGEGRVFWTNEAVQLGMANSSGSLTDAVAKSAQTAENRAKQANGVFGQHFQKGI